MSINKKEKLLAEILENLEGINSVGLYSVINKRERLLVKFDSVKEAKSVRRRLRKSKSEGEYFKIKKIS